MLKDFAPTVMEEKIASQEVIDAAKESMEAVVTEGSGKYAFANMNFPIAGKTGTAHVADGDIKYANGVYQASFVGYFPANDPQFTCIVVIRSKPYAALHYGGTLAGPVFREVSTKLYSMYVPSKVSMAYSTRKDSTNAYYAGGTADLKNVYSYLKLPYSDSSVTEWSGALTSNGSKPVIRDKAVTKRSMPDVKGMGLRDALYLLENMGVKVSVLGKGKVKNQSVAPGTSIKKGLLVVLELS